VRRLPGLGRRAVLKAMAAAPLATLASRAEATDYASPAEVFAAIDRLEAALDERLARLAAAMPAAAELARSVAADHARHRAARARLRVRLRAAEAAPAVPAPARTAGSVDDARAVAQELVHAYAEGLPALGDATAVDVLAHHMVDDARHLAVLQMWTEADQGA
jgi:hypothetical protein